MRVPLSRHEAGKGTQPCLMLECVFRANDKERSCWNGAWKHVRSLRDGRLFYDDMEHRYSQSGEWWRNQKSLSAELSWPKSLYNFWTIETQAFYYLKTPFGGLFKEPSKSHRRIPDTTIKLNCLFFFSGFPWMSPFVAGSRNCHLCILSGSFDRQSPIQQPTKWTFPAHGRDQNKKREGKKEIRFFLGPRNKWVPSAVL